LQSELDNCARILIEQCGHVSAGETVAIVANDKQDDRLLNAMAQATREVQARPIVLQYGITAEKTDPPEELLRKLLNVDAIFLCTTVPFNYEYLSPAWKLGARIISASRVSLESYLRIVPIDYSGLSSEMHRIGSVIENSSTVKIVSSNGTNFSAKLAPMGMRYATSVVRKEGDWAYLPAGTTGICLVEGSAEGVFVCDGVIVDIDKISPPIKFVIKNGTVVDTQCQEQKQLDVVRSWLLKDENANAVVEIGVGFNPNATLISEPEGERVRGSVHIGTGDNIFFGGKIRSESHLDIVILNSSLYCDGRELVKDGKIATW
jgi:leucyl aminopeptidase (aminopeptidase T)